MIARRLDALFIWLRARPFFLRFTWFTRILLMAGFLPTGWVKLMGRRFTLISPEHPIGALFEALYQTGLFWRFIGFAQVAAAVLIVIPATAHLGAAAFFPVSLYIFIITVALSFKGTPVITGLMLLAVFYLLFWDYHRFRGLIFDDGVDLGPRIASRRFDLWEKIGFSAFATGLLLTFLGTRSLFPKEAMPVPIIIGFLGGLLALIRFLTSSRFSNVERG
jgi:hypothetical protein